MTDTENHHIHTYCKDCKRNLPYDTTIHNCIVGVKSGQKHPDMNPNFLVNIPWWNEPLIVQQENNYIYLKQFQYLLTTLPLDFEIPLPKVVITELD